jgi:hypothetical protein
LKNPAAIGDLSFCLPRIQNIPQWSDDRHGCAWSSLWRAIIIKLR